MTVLDIRFSDWIQKGLALFVEHALLLILSGLVALAIIGVTMGLLAGPMLAGMVIIITNLMDDRLARPTVNDLFRGFDYFKATIPVTLGFYALALIGFILNFIPGPGFVLNAVVTSVGSAIGILTVYQLVVRRMPPRESAPVWWEIFKVNWGPLLGFFILTAIIGGIGVLLLWVGMVVTFPLYLCILGVAYASMARQSAAL